MIPIKKRHLRRDKSRKHPCFWLQNVPADYRRERNKEWSSECKVVLQKILQGKEVEFPPFKKDAAWDYW